MFYDNRMNKSNVMRIMSMMINKHKKSSLGNFTRLIGLLLLIGIPLFSFAPEYFPRGFDKTYDFLKIPIREISLKARLIIALIIGLHESVLVIGIFAMAKTFDLLASKNWFLPDLSYHLKTFGISLVVFILSTPVVSILITLAMTLEMFYNYPAYKGKDTVLSFAIISSQGLLVIMIGVLLILLSKVLRKANENTHELEEIV